MKKKAEQDAAALELALEGAQRVSSKEILENSLWVLFISSGFFFLQENAENAKNVKKLQQQLKVRIHELQFENLNIV